MAGHPDRSVAGRRRRRGASIIEVLLAMTILAIMMVGILQMFSLSLLVNAGSSARTQMLFKAQQVVENIRVAAFLGRQGNFTMANALLAPTAFTTVPTFRLVSNATSGVPAYDLPYNSSSTPPWSPTTPWGPTGANVVEVTDGPFRISYTITEGPPPGFTGPTGTISYTIRVTCVPEPVTTTGGPRFFGLIGGKRIDYVAQIVQ